MTHSNLQVSWDGLDVISSLRRRPAPALPFSWTPLIHLLQRDGRWPLSFFLTGFDYFGSVFHDVVHGDNGIEAGNREALITKRTQGSFLCRESNLPKERAMRRIPNTHLQFRDTYPDIARAYEELGKTTQEWGPLDKKTRELVKLAVAVGNRHEGAVHSHTRRALDAGASKEEVRHVLVLALTTIGFPNMIAALTWAEDVLQADSHTDPEEPGAGL
jgi:4-carboxymuconolactone decarboxylase